MFKVYWTEEGELKAHVLAREFESTQLSEALELCEQLRGRQRSGEAISFITMASERIPGDVTKRGVDVVGPDYDWKKRR